MTVTAGEVQTDGPVEQVRPSSGVTPPAVLIGLTLSILLAFLIVSEQSLGGSPSLTQDGFGAGPLSLLFGLICTIGLMKRAGIVRSGLRPQELLVIFSMTLMVPAASSVVIYLFPHLVGFVYYATHENDWENLVLPILPEGLVVNDPAAAKGFFEGFFGGARFPYRAWVGPLCAWGVFLGVFYFTLMSLMVILRKPWLEQERLPFPLAQLPLSLIEGKPGRGPLFHDKIFWFGFVPPALIGLSVIANRFLPFIPAVRLYFYTRFYRNSIGLLIYAHFFVLGISYLVSLEILSSILLFTLISYGQIFLIVTSASPILGSPPYDPYVHYTHLHQEALGALAVLVGLGLYEARHHVKDVCRKAFGSAPDVDDSDEIFSYRSAVLGSIVGFAFICYWLGVMGVSLWGALIFVGIMLIVFIGVTRILAEAGVVMSAPLSPVQVLVNSGGTQMLGSSTLAGFFLAYPWSYPQGPHVMASTSTVLKLTHRKTMKFRPLGYALILGLLAGGVGTAAAILYYVTTMGTLGFAYSGHVIGSLASKVIYFGGAIGDPSSEGQPIRLLWAGVGAVAMGSLIFARQRFFWWPVHPIGFPVGTICPSWWVNMLAAWLIKRNVLKYGGASLYGRTRPFFLGLIMGQAVIAATSSVVAILTGRI